MNPYHVDVDVHQDEHANAVRITFAPVIEPVEIVVDEDDADEY
jgi:hypothetical protein